MQLDRIKNEVVDSELLPGLLSVEYRYKVTNNEGTIFHWLGPKFSPEMWYQITSFFKYTYDRYRSESQVRLFVNIETREWKAWAFPQEANTGMTAHELENSDEWKEQRQQFGPEWLYYGTVHHHCAMGAFQSATDKSNEENQDGVHITVGRLDEKMHDIHVRFYRKGIMCLPKLTWFWETEDVEAECPEKFRKFIPASYREDQAKAEMCTPSSVEFPEKWKENIIEKKKVDQTPPLVMMPTSSGGTQYKSQHSDPIWARSKSAWGQIKGMAKRERADYEEVVEMIENMATSPGLQIQRIMAAHKIDADDLVKEIGGISGTEWQDDLAEHLGVDPVTGEDLSPEELAALALNNNKTNGGEIKTPEEAKPFGFRDTMTPEEEQAWEAWKGQS